jgi:hypothetical protein
MYFFSQGQVVLGMVKIPKAVCGFKSHQLLNNFEYFSSNQQTKLLLPLSSLQAQSSDIAQPTAAPAPPSSVKASVQDHVSLPQPPLPSYQQGAVQHSGPLPSAASNVASNMDLPTMPANPPQSTQAKGYPMHQMPAASVPQSSQHPNMTLPHVPLQYSNLPSHLPVVHSQQQQPLQNPGMFNQQLQPSLPLSPRPPPMQSFAHQMHPQISNSFGMAHANAPQHILQQSMFHVRFVAQS